MREGLTRWHVGGGLVLCLVVVVWATATLRREARPRPPAPVVVQAAASVADQLFRDGILKSLRCDLRSAFVDHIEWQRHTVVQQIMLSNGLSLACETQDRINVYAAFDTERRHPLPMKQSGMR